MKKILLMLLIFGALIFAALFLIDQKAEVASLAVPSKRPLSIETAKPVLRTLTQSQSFLAHISSRQRTEIATRYSSGVIGTPVHESQHVRRGDLLIELDAGDVERLIETLSVKVLAMRSEVAVTAKRHQSNETLYRAGAISEESYDTSRLLLESKKAALDELNATLETQKKQLPYYSIRAPHDGVVGTVFAHAGDLALPGKALLTLHSGEKIARFAFPSGVSIEKNAVVMSRGAHIGSVSAIYANAPQGLFEAEAALNPDTAFVHGEMIPVEVIQKSVTHCSVPSGALLQTRGAYQVMQYSSGAFVALDVDLIVQKGDFAAVEPCPEHEVAVASPAKLASLPFRGSITVAERP